VSDTKKATVTIVVDGREIEANPGELVIAAAKRHGTYIPRFCYHERMNSVGMCRMCIVDIDTGRGPGLAVSCMTNVAEGMKVDTANDRVRKAQEGVLEFLLINHPLDCPVCDKGGECPLQDQTLSHGPGETRFVEEKRHFAKPIPISNLVFLDRERCILCDRCTRFAKEVAGDPLIAFTHRGNKTQVLTFPDDPFSSYFSGNTVQICPVGALTASPYRFRARPWDLERTESTCMTCSVGCRMVVESSRDRLVRYLGIDSDPVNWGWLCDRGRFNFEAVNAGDRVRAPLVRKSDELVEVSWSEALESAASLLQEALSSGGPASVAFIGGARGTNEDAYAWAKLAKSVVGTDNVDAQLGDGLPAEAILGLPPATIDQACAATTLILLGPDLKEELPVLYIRVRDAAERRAIRILEVSERDTGLTRYAWKSIRHRPGEQAAVARALVGAGTGAGLDFADGELDELRSQVGRGSVVVMAGRANLASSPSFAVDALAALRAALPDARFLVSLRRGNVRGAIAAGLSPGLLPGHVRRSDAGDELRGAWSALPEDEGLDATGILDAAANGRIGCLVLLGADPLSDFPDQDLARRALAGARAIIAVDTFLTESSRLAHVVLAAAAFGEKDGTTTNLEGRVTRVRRKVTAAGTTRPDWAIATELADRLGGDLGFDGVRHVWDEFVAVAPALAGLDGDALERHPDGLVAEAAISAFPLDDTGAVVPARNNYDFRLVVSRTLYDGAIGTDRSPSLSELVEPSALHINPWDHDRVGTDKPVKLVTPRTSMVAELVADDAVPRGVAWLPFNRSGLPAGDLIDVTAPVIDVRVEVM
jgi:NADH-quinone oxidoreductase subunit G